MHKLEATSDMNRVSIMVKCVNNLIHRKALILRQVLTFKLPESTGDSVQILNALTLLTSPTSVGQIEVR